MNLCHWTAPLLVALPLLVSPQTAHQYRDQGYLFFAPGATSPVAVHVGGGGW
jgi:hypothetical protein